MPTLRNMVFIPRAGGGPLRQSARSVLYNQAVPPLSRAYLHAQEDQGPGGGLLVGQGEWLPKLPWAILSVGSSVSSMTYFSPSLCQSCWALTKWPSQLVTSTGSAQRNCSGWTLPHPLLSRSKSRLTGGGLAGAPETGSRQSCLH